MINDFDYENFIKFIKAQMKESSRGEINGLEAFVDYYIDYPPEWLDGVDSDYAKEEIERLVDKQIYSIESYLSSEHSSWIVVQDGKWKLNSSSFLKDGRDRTELEKVLEGDEAELIRLNVFEIDSGKRDRLVNIYNHKVKKYGDSDEKYGVLKLIADSVRFGTKDAYKYIDYISFAGELGRIVSDKKSFEYYETAAKLYRSNYEHSVSAQHYQLAIDSANFFETESYILLTLARNMRIQYELCGDEDNASNAFILENNLKRTNASCNKTKIALSILGVLSDYCQSPRKVAIFAFFLLALSSVVYGFSGIIPSGDDSEQTFLTEGASVLSVFADALYFSVVTFTTLGYGDFSPADGVSKVMANVESLGGLILTSLFLVTLVRKYGR